MSDRNELTLRDADQYDFSGERDRIVDLAGRGYSATYISKAVGLSYPVVCRLLRNEFNERNSKRQDIIQSHSQTVQWLKMKCTEAIANPGLDKNGNPKDWDRKAAELLLKILERESKLFGIDQPTQHNVNVTVEEYTDEELAAQLSAAGYSIPIFTPPPAALPEAIADAEYHVRTETDQQRVGEETPPEAPQ